MFTFVAPNSICPKLVVSLTLPVGIHHDSRLLAHMAVIIREGIDEKMIENGLATLAKLEAVVVPKKMSELEEREGKRRTALLNFTEQTIEQIARSFR